MVLQLNYLLSGVIVTEVFFAYDGFGKALYEAAQFGDIYHRRGLRHGRGVRGGHVAVHLGYRLHLPQSAHPVQHEEHAP